MGLLMRKLFRDVLAARWQFAAVTALVLLGVALFIGSYSGYLNLRTSFDHTYQELSMADYWLDLDKVSRRAATKIDAIPGVEAEGRIVRDLQVSIFDSDPEKIVLRVISLPGDRQPRVNQVAVEEGSYFSGPYAREVLLHRNFAGYYGFRPGDWITLKVNSDRARFRVAGIATSPEYLWVIKSARETYPSPRSFGVIFIPQDAAEKLFKMKGYINEVVMRVDKDADTPQTFQKLKNILREYNFGRIELRGEHLPLETRKRDVTRGYYTAQLISLKDQGSDKALRMDLDAFSRLAIIFPILFLGMAALTVYVLLGRLIQSQRPQIGMLKAIGFSHRQVLSHYLTYALFIGVSGSVLGVLTGIYIAGIFTHEYAKALNIPFVQVETQWPVIAIAVAVAIVFSLAGGLLPALATANMRPAHALRPPLPGGSARHLLERWLPVPAWLPIAGKLALRNILRSPYRSFFLIVGVASAVSLVLSAAVFLDSIQSFMELQYNRIQAYDAKTVFKAIGGTNRAFEAEHWPGVTISEPILEIPYRFRYGGRSEDSLLVGLPPEHSLYHLFNSQRQPVALKPRQLLLTSYLRRQLQVEIGDTVQLEPIVGVTGEREMVVGGFVEQPVGSAGYLLLKHMQEILKASGTTTGLLLDFADEGPSAGVIKKLYDLPETESVEFKAEARQYMDELMTFYYVFIWVMLAFGVALGAAIIFSGVTISVDERLPELGTLHTIGMGTWKIASIITVESLILSSIGIALGIPLGNWLAESFVEMYQAEQFSLTAIIFPRTYFLMVLGLVGVMVISELPSLRRLSRLNLAAVTRQWIG